MIEKINPIYSGELEDFRWVGFGSGSGTNLRECAKIVKPAFIFSDRPNARLLNLEELAGVPREVINGYEACGSYRAAQGNPVSEDEYNERSLAFNIEITNLLHAFEKEQDAPFDLIVLGGYMRLLKGPLLSDYKDRIINVHPSSLPYLVDKGDSSRGYIGGDAVHDAIKDKQMTTRSSVIMVDNGEDHGEILTQGPNVNVWHEYINGTQAEKDECLREYANAHQSFQKVRSDWSTLTTALKMIAEGRIALGTEKKHHGVWRTVYIDEKPMPYEGFQVK